MKTLSQGLQIRMFDLLKKLAHVKSPTLPFGDRWKLQLEAAQIVRAIEAEYEAQS